MPALGYAIEGWPLGLILLIIPLAVLIYQKRSIYYITCFSVFFVYIVLVLIKVIVPRDVSSEFADAMRYDGVWADNINLIPFYFGRFGTLDSSLDTLLLNILITIPFGLGIRFIARIHPRDILWLAPGAGLALEGGQLLISLLLGYPYRQTDINDVLMNALGVLTGYALFRTLGWLYFRVSQKVRIKPDGLSAFLADTFTSSPLSPPTTPR